MQQNGTMNLNGVDVSHNQMTGIYLHSGTLSMSRRSSVSAEPRWGIFVDNGTVNIDSGCKVTQNSVGGGISGSGTVNLADKDIVFNNQPNNCDDDYINCVN